MTTKTPPTAISEYICPGITDGDIDALFEREVEWAEGRTQEDRFWRSHKYLYRYFVDAYKTFETGPKNGRGICSGPLVGTSAGAARTARNLRACYFLMIDIDVGMTFDEAAEIVHNAGWTAILWTTHSHLKQFSAVAETAVTAYAKKHKIPNDATALVPYLRDEKRYRQNILNTIDITTARKEQVPDVGVSWLVSHAPLPRLRVVFLLDKPFVFAATTATQAERIAEWKARYTGLCTLLDLPHDQSCTDPARLMFTPRHAANTEVEHRIHYVWGKCLQVEDINPVYPADARTNPFLAQGGGNGKFETPWLKKFLASDAGKTFDAATAFSEIAPHDVRGGGGDKIDFCCPTEYNHTNGTDLDRGFFISNGSVEGGFYMGCAHTTCKSESGGDRAYYLDKLIQKYGLTEDHLHEYCAIDSVSEEVKEDVIEEVSEEQVPTFDLDAWLKDKPEKMTMSDVGDLPKLLVEGLPESDVLLAIGKVQERMKTNAGISFGRAVRAAQKAHAAKKPNKKESERAQKIRQKEQEKEAARARKEAEREAEAAARAEEFQGSPRNPDNIDPEVYDGPIFSSWPPKLRTAVAVSQLERSVNLSQPLYRRPDSMVGRLQSTDLGMRLEPLMTTAQWRATFVAALNFIQISKDDEQNVDAPPALISGLAGYGDWKFPVLEKFAATPVFSANGTLMLTPGYDASSKTYLDFQPGDFKPLPAVIDDDVVASAVADLQELIRDFPFSDAFDGNDSAPIHLEELDEDGHPLPNMARGHSSRTNFLAMCIQPFVRNMINGPTPNYHIDKPAAGTGAGYLVDFASMLINGTRAPVQTLPTGEDEMRKMITASLREGKPLLFIDNIDRKVDSGVIAGALTSGIWSDRVLGVSEIVNLKINNVWVMAGNNLSFNRDMMRRNVPIRMDANKENPANDRSGKFFKYNPFHDAVMHNRPHLLCCIHILVQNWINKGCPPGSAEMNSFDAWASVMGGILETAGITGFLENYHEYNKDRNDDNGPEKQIVEIILAKRILPGGDETSPITSAELFELLKPPLGGSGVNQLIVDIGTSPSVHHLGMFVGHKMVGRVYSIADKMGNKKRYKLLKKTGQGGNKIYLIRIAD